MQLCLGELTTVRDTIGSILVPIVTQSHTGLHENQFRTLHTKWPNFLHYFLLSENVLNYKSGTTVFYVAYRTLLVMFFVLKFLFCGV